jgi:hypothetical protein
LHEDIEKLVPQILVIVILVKSQGDIYGVVVCLSA